MVLQQLRTFLSMIKFQHTVFALPFALISAFVCRNGLPEWRELFWILLAMVGARSAAMGFNRIVDLEYDRLNPRTATWELPAGRITVREASLFVFVSAAVFVLSAYMLNLLAFVLSFPALGVILLYSYTKRFTSLSHLVLGLALAIAPMGAWIALAGQFALQPMILSVAVLVWVAGFDIIYSCLDKEFDEKQDLHSMVRRFGIRAGLWIARAFHVLFALAMLAFAWLSGLGMAFYAGLFIVAVLLIYEHSLVSPKELSRVNAAFFTVNGVVSMILLVATVVDIFFLHVAS